MPSRWCGALVVSSFLASALSACEGYRASPLSPNATSAPPPSEPATEEPRPSARPVLDARAETPTLTFAVAVRTAVARQPTAKQAHALTIAAYARADEARSALLPQVTLAGLYRRQTGNFVAVPGSVPAGVPSSAVSWNTYDYYSFNLGVTQLLFDFGTTPDRWRSAQASADAQRAEERMTLNQVVLNVASTFFLARSQKALAQVARETLENQRAHGTQTEGLVTVGSQPQINLATALTNISNAEVSLVNAENAYAVTKVQLNQAMGVVGPVSYEVSDEWMSPVGGEDGPPSALYTEALRARPEIVNLAAQIASQELTLRSIKGGYGPSLAAQLSGSETGVDLTALVPNVSAGVTATWLLFQGGLTNAQVREAEANVAALVAQLDAEKLQVKVDVEQARLGVVAAKKNERATVQALINAQEQLRLAEGRYTTGLGNAVELSDAQVAASTAAAQRVQSQYSLSLARAQLLYALGR